MNRSDQTDWSAGPGSLTEGGGSLTEGGCSLAGSGGLLAGTGGGGSAAFWRALLAALAKQV
jgi:hypothetical protein